MVKHKWLEKLHCLHVLLYRFLHWTLTDAGSSELFQLDLRDNTSSLTLLHSSLQQRDIQSGLVPTSGLAQDPETDRIWLSDQLSGDILSCVTSPTLTDCQVEVSASRLGNGVAGELLLMLILVS